MMRITHVFRTLYRGRLGVVAMAHARTVGWLH